MNIRVGFSKREQHLGQKHRDCLVNTADPNVAQIGLGGVANVGHRSFDIREDLLGVLNEFRPGLCQADLPGGPKKQPRAKLVFKGRYALGKS